jgi:hypothetical protein
MTDPVSGRLSDAPPAATEIEPGSTIRAPDRPVYGLEWRLSFGRPVAVSAPMDLV